MSSSSRPASPLEEPRAKIARTDDEVDLFTPESLLQFQKEAIWRQMQEYKEAVSRERTRGEQLKSQRDSLSLFTNFLLKLASQNAIEIDSVENLFTKFQTENTLNEDSVKELLEFIPSLENTDRNSLATLYDHARAETAIKSSQELYNHQMVLKNELDQSNRTILRLKAEIGKLKKKTPVDHSAAIIEAPSKKPESVEEKSTLAELEAIKQITEFRLQELTRVEAERQELKVKYERLKEKFNRIPEAIREDFRPYAALSANYEKLKENFKNRMNAIEDLERYYTDDSAKKSHLITELQVEMSQRRYAAKKFADDMEAECVRLRKDRDQMRELYESVNMQASSFGRQNSQLQALNEQLSKKLELTDEKLKGIINSAGDSEAAILSEIESIGEAFEVLQKQNNLLIRQISEKEDLITKISAEKLKSEFAVSQTQREADLTKQKARSVEADAMKAAELAESELQKLRATSKQHELILIEKTKELEALKWKMGNAERQYGELKIAYDSLLERASDPVVAGMIKQVEQQQFERRRLEERLQIVSSKLEAYSASSGGALAKDLQEELGIYKKLMKCNSCHIREKNVVLTKCFHVFCKECIDTRLETRQRKCPNCGESFGVNDVKPIYL